MGRRTRSN
jgi:hypothetical protein